MDMKKMVMLLAVIAIAGCMETQPAEPADIPMEDILRNVDTSEYAEVSCDALNTDTTLTVLTIGQSKAANIVEGDYLPSGGVYTMLDGKCYHAGNSMLGSSGQRSNVWSRLGDRIIANTRYDTVVFITTAVSGSSITEWQPGTDNYVYALQQVQASPLGVGLILQDQGEADALYGLSTEAYEAYFTTMLDAMREDGIFASLYLAQATYCLGVTSDAVHEAQYNLTALPGVYQGPDTDLIDSSYRYDGCHFSGAGADIHADMWFSALSGFFG